MLIKKQITSFIFNKSVILLFILLLAFFLRIHNLDVPYYDNDELRQGLLAHNITKTGDITPNISGFKTGGTFYESIPILLKIPFTYLFNLTIFSIRLASVFTGTLTILVFYLFIKEYFQNKNLALIGSTLMTVSPWHIIMSRWALQSITTPFFLLLSLLFLFKYKDNSKPIYLFLSAIFIGLGFYTYAIFPLAIFLLIALFAYIYRDIFLDHKKILYCFISLVLLALIILPYTLNISDALIRAKGENIFNEKFITESPFKVFLKNILLHISPVQYFIYYPHNYYVHTPRLEYFILLPFFLIGIFLLFKRKEYFILGWFLLSSIPPSLTRIGDSINPNRAIIILPAIIIITAYGILYSLENIKFKKIFFSAILIILLIEMHIYLPKYVYSKYEYGNFPNREAYYEDLIKKITTNFSNYKTLVLKSCVNYLSWEITPFLFFKEYVYKNKLNGKILIICEVDKDCLILERALYVLCSKNHQGFIYLDQVSRRNNSTDVQYVIAVLNQSTTI